MYVYLTAGADDLYDASAYSYLVANSPLQGERHRGWTVPEAYLHGLLSLSNYIISHKMYPSVSTFVICTPSQQVIDITTKKYLQLLQDNNWKRSDGKYLFHSELLKELYFHHVFYRERHKKWEALTEVGETEYKQFERCQEHVQNLLKGDWSYGK